jgi:hypothetical protein
MPFEFQLVVQKNNMKKTPKEKKISIQNSLLDFFFAITKKETFTSS